MSEQMRKEFNEWIDSLSFEALENIDENSAWQAWQASRAVIVFELPDWSEYDTPRQVISACGRSLTEAGFGVSYK